MIFPFLSTTFSLEYSWADQWVRTGWRVQQNIFNTDLCRLLNPVEAIVATGDKHKLIADGKRKSKRINSKNGVIVLHGICRTRFCMRKMTDALIENGYVVADISYPSTQQSFVDCVKQVQHCVAEMLKDGIEKIDFIGHSLGGLIIRAVIFENSIPLGKVITIGTPHNGSCVADMMADWQAYKYMTGDCGQILTTERILSVPMPDIPIAVIAGGKGWLGYNPALLADNDGVVLVTETRIANEASFTLAPAIHSYLTESSIVIRQILQVLKG